MLINEVKKPYQISTLTCSPLKVCYNNNYLRIVNLGNSSGWVASDVANLFDVLVCSIFKEFQKLSLVNWRYRVTLTCENLEECNFFKRSQTLHNQEENTPVWVLRDEAFWLLILVGVGISTYKNIAKREEIKKWLFASIIPKLIYLGFYGEYFSSTDNLSLVTSQFLEASKKPFLAKIEELEQVNAELRFKLEQQDQKFNSNLEQIQAGLQEFGQQQVKILNLLETQLQVQPSYGKFISNCFKSALALKKS